MWRHDLDAQYTPHGSPCPEDNTEGCILAGVHGSDELIGGIVPPDDGQDASNHLWSGGRERSTPGTQASAGGQSPWGSMALDEIISILQSMRDGDARGDAEAVLQAINEANGVADDIDAAFGSGSGTLLGYAVDMSVGYAQGTAGDIRNGAQTASQAHKAMTAAADAVSSAKSNESLLESLREALKESPESAPTVRNAVDTLMSGTYTMPMNDAQGGLPAGSIAGETRLIGSGTSGPSGGGGGGGGGNLTSSATHSTSGGVSDLGEYGKSMTPTAGAPDGGGSGPTTATPASASTDDKPLSLGTETANNNGGGADDPDSLTRGGRGTADGMNGTAPAGIAGGAIPAAGMAGAPGGAPRVGGALPGGSGTGSSAGTGSGSGMTPMARRLMGAMPTSGVSNPSTPVSGVPGGAGRAGAAPLGGAPHGARSNKGGDDEHKTPHYLHTKENGAEIVGTLPLVSPPVIGDWAPPAKPESEDR